MNARVSTRAATAVVGMAQLVFPRGSAPEPELKLILRAITAACAEAGIDPHDVDGFSSYSEGYNDGTVVAGALNARELTWSNLVWGGGGGGSAAAIVNAVSAIATGQATCVAVYRAFCENEGGRLAYAKSAFGSHLSPHGVVGPAELCALRTQRMLATAGVPRSAMRAVVLASYEHAQQNPDALAFGRPISEHDYDDARRIVDPFGLYDCSRESDGAAALILVAADRAQDLNQKPAYVLAGAQGSSGGFTGTVENVNPYTSAGFQGVARRMYAAAGIGPADVQVAQIYENFSGPAVASLIDHGLCPPGPEAGEFLRLDNLIAPSGALPINTSGGNLADSFVNGMGLSLEAVRQIRGQSCNQVADAHVSLLAGGPMSPLVSSVLFGSAETV